MSKYVYTDEQIEAAKAWVVADNNLYHALYVYDNDPTYENLLTAQEYEEGFKAADFNLSWVCNFKKDLAEELIIEARASEEIDPSIITDL